MSGGEGSPYDMISEDLVQGALKESLAAARGNSTHFGLHVKYVKNACMTDERVRECGLDLITNNYFSTNN